MRKTYKRTATVIAVSFSVLFVAALIILREPIAIKYHNQRISALLNRKPKPDPAAGLSFFGEDWIGAFEKHRDKLVELGYLERKEFPLSTIKSPSLRFRRLWEELGIKFPNYPYVEGLGYDSDSPATIVVWGKPNNLAEWERIISAHDTPPTNIVDVSQKGEFQGVLSFIGRWANEDGEVCYIISDNNEGFLRIETPPNKAWRIILRNIRLEGRKIIFDRFHYTDPNEDHKSIIDQSGEHSFSGVRCETVLKVNPKDSNELFVSGSAVSKYGILTDPNKYILRKLK